MKAAVLHGIRDIRIEDRPNPEPKAGEALVRVTAVGVCGSDVHYYIDGRIGDQIVREPQTVGHEVAGRIERLGPGCDTDMKPGDLVAVEPGVSCGRCELCIEGRPNACPNVIFYGTPPVDGAFQEYLAHPIEYLYACPEGVTDAEAAMTEPLGIGIHAARLGRVGLGDTVAVLGAGTIGLCTLMAARAAGATRILATDLLESRLEIARKVGATDTFVATDGGSDAVLGWIGEVTLGRGVDVTFECAGQVETMRQAVHAARIGGRATLVGITTEDDVPVPIHIARRKELELINVRRSRFTIPASLALISQKRMDVASLVTHEFGLEKLADAIELVHEKADGVVKAMIVL